MGRSRSSQAKLGPSSDDAYQIAYYVTGAGDLPARDFLRGCPMSVRAKLMAIVTQVALAPPPRFSGGGYWEAMKREMSGFYEVRADGPSRRHYRLFCVLDSHAVDRNGDSMGPLLTILTGADKAYRTEFPASVYAGVRELGDRYRATNPRPIA